MGGLKIHLPRELNPEGSRNDLSRTLCEKICEGITRKVGQKISGLTQLSARPFDAEVRIGGLDTNRNLRGVKVKPFDAQLHLGTDLNFNVNRPYRMKSYQMKMLKTTRVGGDLDLQTDLSFDY